MQTRTTQRTIPTIRRFAAEHAALTTQARRRTFGEVSSTAVEGRDNRSPCDSPNFWSHVGMQHRTSELRDTQCPASAHSSFSETCLAARASRISVEWSFVRAVIVEASRTTKSCSKAAVPGRPRSRRELPSYDASRASIKRPALRNRDQLADRYHRQNAMDEAAINTARSCPTRSVARSSSTSRRSESP